MTYSEWLESECECFDNDKLPCERCMTTCFFCRAYLPTHEHCAEYEKIYGPGTWHVKQ